MKKSSIVKAFTASLAAVSMLFVTACNNDATEFTGTKAAGLEISEITLSKSSVVLSGTRGITTAELTASALPSYATDTTIYWSSSDTSIVTLSAETGSSVTLTLAGVGSAVVTARSESGVATASCKVICELETTAPDTVSAVTATANANNVYFEWTDPVDYDSDLDHIRIESNSGEYTEVAAGLEYGWVKGLSAGTEYNFTLTAVDLNGNESVGYSVTATTETELDAVAPEAVSDLELASNGGTSLSFNWTLSGDAVYQKVVLGVAEGVSLPKSVTSEYYSEKKDSSIEVYVPNNTTNTITLSGLTAGDTYTVSVYALNRDFVVSEVKSLEETAAPTVSNIAVTSKYTGSIIVTWNDYDSDDYHYVVKVGSILSDSITSGVETAYVPGLEAGTEYEITVQTLNSSDELLGESSVVKYTPKTICWTIINTYNSSYLFAPYITDTTSNNNICTVSAGSSWKYPYWIVRPSLSTPQDKNTFSLEASSSKSLSGASGLYLCIDNVKSFPDGGDASGWGYPASSHAYHAYALTETEISTDMGSLDYASFELLTSSCSTEVADGFSSWYVWKVGSTGRYLYDTYLNVSGETSYVASSGDYAFAYSETIVD